MQVTLPNKLALSTLSLIALSSLYFATTLPAEAKTLRKNVNASSTMSERASTTVDTSCMAEAVTVRETALLGSVSDFNDDLTDALTKRKEALSSAWGITTLKDRNEALKTAWKNWRTASVSAHKTLRAERKVAWDEFRKTATTNCKTTLPKDEMLEKAKSDALSL